MEQDQAAGLISFVFPATLERDCIYKEYMLHFFQTQKQLIAEYLRRVLRDSDGIGGSDNAVGRGPKCASGFFTTR